MKTKSIKCALCGAETEVGINASSKSLCPKCRKIRHCERSRLTRLKYHGTFIPKTKFKLEPPYSNDWDYGYMSFDRKSGRQLVKLRKKGVRSCSSTLYSRYLLSVKLGHYIAESDEVDHIDGDKTNDIVSNLRVMKKDDHHKRHSEEKSASRTPKHGSWSEYFRHGCRCGICLEAYEKWKIKAREYSKKSKAKKKIQSGSTQ